MNTLQKIWSEAGYEDSECQCLLGDLIAKVKLLYATEVSSETRILELARDQVLQRISYLRDLYSKLGRPFEVNISGLGENCNVLVI